jgi:hypothetical protein
MRYYTALGGGVHVGAWLKCFEHYILLYCYTGLNTADQAVGPETP